MLLRSMLAERLQVLTTLRVEKRGHLKKKKELRKKKIRMGCRQKNQTTQPSRGGGDTQSQVLNCP